MQPAYLSLIAFLHIFLYIGLFCIFLTFRQPSTGHMGLPTGTKWQCHNTCGLAWMVDMKVISHYPFMMFTLNILGNIV